MVATPAWVGTARCPAALQEVGIRTVDEGDWELSALFSHLPVNLQCSQNKRLKRETEFVLPTQKTSLGSSPPQGPGRFPPALASPRPSPHHPKGPCPQTRVPSAPPACPLNRDQTTPVCLPTPYLPAVQLKGELQGRGGAGGTPPGGGGVSPIPPSAEEHSLLPWKPRRWGPGLRGGPGNPPRPAPLSSVAESAALGTGPRRRG